MIQIKSNTINFAWYQLCRIVPTHTYMTRIDKGSYEEQDVRKQFVSVAIEITDPEFDMIPILPPGCEGIQPTTMEYVESYFENYIIGSEVSENEAYTYGERINISLPTVIENLKKYPFSNQHVIEIARPEDIEISDPACARLIDFKVIPENNRLDMHVYFRSWELWAGLPTNLAALEMLKQYVSAECSFTNGKIFAYSSGLHVYGENLKNVYALLNKQGD